MFAVIHGDCRDVLQTLSSNSFDAIVTDPPYELGFGGNAWDASGIAYDVDVWKECLRVVKPGGHLLSFGASRTYHRMAVAIEDAGFEPRDTLKWIYAQGMPKGFNISKGIDKFLGVERPVVGKGINYEAKQKHGGTWTGKVLGKEPKHGIGPLITAPGSPEAAAWEGWNTALKPAYEPIVMMRKPLDGNIVENTLKWAAGGLNVAACMNDSRFPANVIFSEESLPFLEEMEPGSSRFFYVPKATVKERDGNEHPTVKPLMLMRYLIRLVTPHAGWILDPFFGSGTTGVAAMAEGKRIVGIEKDIHHAATARKRTEAAAMAVVMAVNATSRVGWELPCHF